MAISEPTKKGSAYGTTSTTAQITGLTVTAGNTLIACCSTNDATCVSCIYNDGATPYAMTKRGEIENSGHQTVAIYELYNAASASGSGTVTLTVSAAEYPIITLYEVSGLDNTGAFDKSSSGTDRDPTQDSGETAETSTADQLLMGVTGWDNTVAISAYTGDCIDNVYDVDHPSNTGCLHSATEIVSATGTYDMITTTASKVYYAALICTFKAASGAPPSTAPQAIIINMV